MVSTTPKIWLSIPCGSINLKMLRYLISRFACLILWKKSKGWQDSSESQKSLSVQAWHEFAFWNLCWGRELILKSCPLPSTHMPSHKWYLRAALSTYTGCLHSVFLPRTIYKNFNSLNFTEISIPGLITHFLNLPSHA